MTTLYLIRHAEAEGNLYRRIHGWYDALITENGYRQLDCLAERFRDVPLDAAYSSDLFRTETTARAVCRGRDLEVRTDPDLRELNFGDWEDRPWGEIYRTCPGQIQRFNASDPDWQAPHGESLIQAGLRVEGALRRIAAAHPGQTVAVFTHGTVIRQVLSHILALPPEQWGGTSHSENTAVTCLDFDGERFSIRFRDDASHLPEELGTMSKQKWWRGSSAAKDVNLWYRPIDWGREQGVYLEARREAWGSIHGERAPFQPEGFLEAARLHLSRTPWGVTAAMAGDSLAGFLQLDPERYREEGAGYIPFCYLRPEFRAQHLGIQLIGQAVAFYRPLGRDELRLRCAPYNDRAQHFYRKYGFSKVGDETGSRVPLEILEKYIGYQW